MGPIRAAGCIIILALLAAPVLAFGVSPARRIQNYQENITGTITVVNNQKESLDLYIIPRGNLSEYVTVSPKTVTLTPGTVDKKVSYSITIPPGKATPGKHLIDLVLLTFQNGGASNTISANAGVVSQVEVDVPYNGAYLESRIDYSKSDNWVVVPLFNKGDAATTADVTLLIYGPTNALVSSSTKQGIDVGARSYAEVPIDLPDLNAGTYLAKVRIDYGSRMLDLSKQIDVGKPQLVPGDLNATMTDEIVRLSLPVVSQWNQGIKEAYALYDISTAQGTFLTRVKTPSVSLDAFGKSTLVGYWDGASEGTYSVSITLYYDGQTDTIERKLTVTPTGVTLGEKVGNVTASGTSTWLIFGVIMLVIINIVLITFVLRKRR